MNATAGQAEVKSLADRFGIEPGMVVMEMGYDEDVDQAVVVIEQSILRERPVALVVMLVPELAQWSAPVAEVRLSEIAARLGEAAGSEHLLSVLQAPAGIARGWLDAAADHGAVLLCAEALGAMEALQTATLEYIRTRQQFGRFFRPVVSGRHAGADW